jgi:hypothetical protein
VTLPRPLAARLDALLATHARGPAVTGSAPTWADIGIDSLGLVSFVVACEDELGLAVPDRVLARLRGPGELRAWLDGQFADPTRAAVGPG